MQQATLHQQAINFKKERDFSEKLNATFAFLSQNFKPIGKNLFLIAGPFALLMGICYGIYQSYTFGFDFTNMGQIPWESAGSAPLLVLGVLGMVFFSTVAGTLVIAILMRHIQVYIKEGHAQISTGALWNTIWKDFFNVLGTSLFIMFGVILLMFVVAIPLAVLGASGGANPVVIGLLAFLGFVAFLFFLPSLTLLYPIRSMEKVGVFTSLSRMFRLISGKWLSTIGLLIVIVIIHSILSVVFAVPMYIVLFMKAIHSGGVDFVANPSADPLYNILLSLTSGISMLGSYILYSIVFIAVTFQYFNLVERKEGRGLMERMEDFGKQKPDKEDDDEHY